MYILTDENGKKWKVIEKKVKTIEEIPEESYENNLDIQKELIRLYKEKKNKRLDNAEAEKMITELEEEYETLKHERIDDGTMCGKLPEENKERMHKIEDIIEKTEVLIASNKEWMNGVSSKANTLKEESDWWTSTPFGPLYVGPSEYNLLKHI